MKQQLLSLIIFLAGAGAIIGGTTVVMHEPAPAESPATVPALNGGPGTTDPSANLSTALTAPAVSRDDDDDDWDDDDDDGGVPASMPVTPSPTPAPAVSAGVATYTLAQVALHATAADCWTAVNNSVYNVTPWIQRHPGGAQTIIGMCGRDASADFSGQHGGQRRPEQELASFKIGVLK